MVEGGRGRDWVVEGRSFGGDVGGVGGGEGLGAFSLIPFTHTPVLY
jgi:hypothetical protein